MMLIYLVVGKWVKHVTGQWHMGVEVHRYTCQVGVHSKFLEYIHDGNLVICKKDGGARVA